MKPMPLTPIGRALVLGVLVIALVFLPTPPQPAAAGTSDDVYVVYDDASGELVCWYEATVERTTTPCANAHSFTDGLHLYEGQRVYVQVIGATYEYAFAVEVTAEGLPEHKEHVFGALSELPALSLLEAAATVVPGAPGVPAGAPDPVGDVLRGIATLDEKPFAETISKITSIGQDSKVMKLSGLELAASANHLSASLAALGAEIKSAEAVLSTTTRTVTGTITSPSQVRAAATSVSALLDAVLALRAQVEILDVSKDAKAVMEAYPAILEALPQDALLFDEVRLGNLVADLERMNIGTLATALKEVGAGKAKKYDHAAMPFVSQEAFAGVTVSAATRKRILANLQALHNTRLLLKEAGRRIRELKNPTALLTGKTGSIEQRLGELINKDLLPQQGRLEAIAKGTVTVAAKYHEVVRKVPLSGRGSLLFVGRWSGNNAVKVTLKKGTRGPRFVYAGVRSSNAKLSGDAPEAKEPMATVPAAETVAQFGMEVRAQYRFQVTAGIVVSGMSGADYELVENKTTVDEQEVTQRFFLQTRDDDYRYFPTLNLVVYFSKRDFRPRRPRFSGDEREVLGTPRLAWLCDAGLLVGFNLGDPSRDLLLGLAWNTQGGFGIQAGVDLGFEHRLPGSLQPGDTIQNAVVVQDHLTWAPFLGISVSSQVLTDFVGLVFKK